MRDEAARFRTGVEASDAVLLGPPDYWSYSALKEVEACPRRFELSRAQYPDLWDRRGYPQLPTTAALLGDAVHAALETIVHQLLAAGCTSIKDSAAVAVLRELGGFTAVVERAIQERLARLKGNPRLDAESMKRINTELRDRLPAARAQVQTYLCRATLPLPEASESGAGPAEGAGAGPSGVVRHAAGIGAHAETPLASESLRLRGRIDLLIIGENDVEITDYKTGTEDPSHRDQLELYALLWHLDRVVNPEGRPTTRLIASYPTREVTFDAPSTPQLLELEVAVRERVAGGDREVAVASPTARPSEENCSFCQVRQLCGEYWQRLPDPGTLVAGAWFDYQGVVGPQNGTRSWWMLSEGSGRRQLLLRTSSAAKPLAPGRRIRVLGVRLEDDPEVDGVVAAMSPLSEVFVLTAER